jgi:hypothetical protein
VNESTDPDNVIVPDETAGSKKNTAKDCRSIKEKYAYKRNGFYWVKTKCMPEA